MNLREIGAPNAQSNQPTLSGAAAPCEMAQRSNRRAPHWTSRARLFAASALAALSFAVPAAFAATTTVSVLIDGDNNPATGCSVATANGAFAGVDRVLNTTVVADGAGYRTQSISLQYCNGGNLGAAQTIDSSALPIARGNGVGGTTAVETFVPNSFLPTAGQQMRVGVTSLGSDGLTGRDALTSNGAGPILVEGPPLLIVPTLATASLVLTALLIAGSLWLARRRGWRGMQLVVVMAFALSLSGALIAAIVRDGLIADWTGIAPVATDPAGDAPPGSDITNLYSTVENGNVFFRVDVLLNSPPVANAQTVTAIVGTPRSITLTGSDFEASPLTFTVVTQPTQGVLTGTAPNLTYTPNALATASDSFTFKVNDGSVDSAIATVTIGNTRAPAITSANNVIFIPTQANTFAFASNGIPTPTATFGACSPALPSVTFTANSSGGGTLSGNPTVAEAGVHTCTFTSTNGVLPNATQTFTLTVGGAPTITSVATLSVPELAAFTHTITTSSVLPITAMTSVGALPTGATFAYAGAPAATATIAGTPAVCSRGAYPVTLGVSNSVASTTQSFNLTVRPVNQAPSFSKGADVTVLEDAAAQTVAGWATARNAGAACESAQTLSFEIVSNSNAALFSAAPAVNGANGDLTFTPAANANGTATLTVRIKDNGGTADGGVDTSATQSFVINVTAVNDAPSFVKGADVSVLQNATAQTVTPWATAISTGPADEAAQTVTFQVVNNSNPAMFSAGPAISPSGTLTFTPAANQPGVATITVNIKDSGGTANGGVDTSANQTFTITVTAVNQVPSFTKGADQTSLEDAGAQTIIAWATAISPGPASETAQTVAFQILSNSNAALFSAAPAVSQTGVLTYATAANVCGTAAIGLNIKDNGGTANGGVDTSATQTFNITVTCVNDAPVFVKGADVTVLQNAPAQTVANWATGIGPGGGADEAAQTVAFQIVSNTNAAMFSAGPAISPTGTLTFTPAANQPGTATITINLKDNGGVANGGFDTSANQTFVITVSAVNQAPSFTKGADQTVFEDAGAQTVTPWATGISAGPASDSAQTLTFQITGNSNAALFSAGPAVSSTGVLTYTTAANANGTATITLNLKDSGGTANGGVDTSAAQTFIINVTPVNDAPSFVKGADQAVNSNAGAVSVTPWATAISPGPADEAGQAVSFNITGNTNSSLFSVQPAVAVGGALTFTPNPATLGGTATVTLTAQDNGGTANGGINTSAAQTFNITVRVAPAITSAAATTFGVGSAGSFTFTASGSPAPTFTLTACSPALPASITAAGSLLSGTPLTGQGGVYNCTLTATNAAGSATQAFALTIAQAPVAVADGGTVLAGATLTVAAPGLLGNDQLSVPAATLTFFGGGSLGGAVTDNAAGTSVPLGTGALQVNANGGLTFTPNTGFIGPFTFSYRIANSQGTSDALVTIDVNRAPLFTGAATGTLQVGIAGSVAFSATGWPAPAVNTAACTPALPASVTAASTTAGTSGTITFSGTPSAGDAGTYSCPLTASNIVAPAATQTVTITIASTPTFTSANSVNFVVGAAQTFNIVTTGIPAATLTNPGGCALPAGLTLNLGAATVSGTATATGTASCNLVATNVAGTANQTLTVNVLQAPSFISFGPYNLTAGNTAAFSATASGVPLPVITQTVGALPAGVTVASNPAGTINFSGTPTATGTFPITLSATNTASTVTQPATINVTCPTLTVTPTTISNPVVGTPFSQAFAASGMNSSTFVWTATGLPASGLSISPTTGVVSGTPTVAGPISFTVIATGAASCAGNTGLINATVNQAPAFTSANNATFTVGTAGTFTATASGSPAPTVTGSCTGLPSGVTLTGATLSGTPAANTGGSYPAVCTFNANNGVGPVVSQTFSLTVNQALAVTSPATAALPLNQAGSFTITTSGFPATNGITLTAIPGPGACVLPTGLTFSYVSGTTATISGTPTTSTPVTCLVTAVNGVSTATQSLTIVAASIPVAVNDSLQTLQNTTLSSSITINDTPGVPPATITFGGGSLAGDAGTNAAGTLVNLAGGVGNFTISASGVLTLTTPPTIGTYTVNYRLTNISGSSDGIITIIVGTAPTLTGVVPGTATVGTLYTVTLTSGGSPAPTTSLQGGSTLPAGISLTGNTLSGTPTSSAAGPFTGSLVATNTFGTSSPAVSYSISVSCPALTVNPTTVADPLFNTAYSPTVTFTAAGLAGAYTWAGTGVPAGMTVSTGGVFSGTPTVSGAQSMVVTGTHTSGCQATRTYTFTITVPPPSVTTSGGNTTFTEDGPAVVVDGAVTPASPGTTTLASATLTITGGLVTSEDSLGFVNTANITGNYVVGTGILTLTGVDTIAAYQTALRSVTYNNSSQNPNVSNRTVSFVINNGSASSAAASKTVAVVAVDDAPVAVADAATVLEDSGATAITVLANDTDVDGGPKSIASVTQPANGVVVITGGGTGLTYAPNANYCNNPPGTTLDTFTYALTPGGSSATVTMTVTCVDDAPVAVNDSATVLEDSGATAINVLANDTDVDGGPKSIASVTQPANGTVVITGGGTGLTYAPNANYCNTPPGTTLSTFTYTLAPGGSTATVSVTVTCVDDAPVAVNDAATVLEDSGATAINVLANDTDIDAGPKSIASVTQPANGVVVITGGGTGLTYAPNANYCNAPPGTTLDTFNYTLTPGGSAATVTVTVTCVDDPPVAVADAATVVEDSGANAINVLANDTDIDGGPKLIASVTQPANGTVVITGGGTGLTYAPNANYCNNPPGTTLDTFTYTLTPGSSSTTVTMTVTCQNDPPVAQNKTGIAVQANMKRVGINAGLLVGVTDADNGVSGCTPNFSVASITSVSGGTVSNVNLGAGTFDFDSTPGFTGTAVVNYTVADDGCPGPAATSAPATISLTVSGPVIWFVNSAGAAGNGTLSSPFNTLAAAVAVDAANHGIFLYTGTYSTGITLNTGELLIGQGVTGASFDAVFGITPPAGTIARPTIGGTRPTVQGTVALGASSTVRGLNLTTSASTGLSGGAVTGVTVNEVSVTTTSGTAVNLNGSGGTLSFTSVSSSGAANGISLTSTTGSFTVTGTGGTCTVATPTCTGGSIQSSTGAGILIATSAQSINLSSMKIQNSGTRGIQTTGVNGFTLDNSIITDSAGTATDDGLNMANTSGTLTISNSAIANAPHNGMTVDNFNTNMTAFNFTNNTISCAAGQPCQPSGSIGNDGLLLVMRGTSVLPSGVVSGSTFSGVRAVGVQIQTNDSGRIGVNSGAPGTFALTTGNSFVVQNNTFTGNGQGIDMGTSQVSNMTFQVLNNTIVGKLTSPGAIANTASSHAINAFTAAGAATGPAVHSFVGKIDGNIIGTQGVKDSGAGFGGGVRVVVQGQTTQGVVTVSNNTIRETPNATMLDFFGQNGAAVAGTLAARFKITNNTMPAPSGSNLSLCGPANTACADNGIFVLADQASPVCNSITGNTIYDLSSMNGAFDIFLAERAGPPAGAQLTVEGTGGSNSTYIQANNTLAGAQKFVDEGANTSQVAIGACGIFP